MKLDRTFLELGNVHDEVARVGGQTEAHIVDTTHVHLQQRQVSELVQELDVYG